MLRVLRTLVITFFCLACPLIAISQPQLIAIGLARALSSGLAKEGFPVYSAFDDKALTKQDQKRLNHEYKLLSKEIGKKPDSPELYLRRGNLLDTLGLPQQALDDVKKAFDLGDHSRSAVMSLGIMYYRLADRYAAIRNFKSLIKKDSLDYEAYLHSGMAFLCSPTKFENASKRRLEAIPYFEKSLKIKPDSKESLILLGYCYFMLDRYSEATPLLERAVAVSPKTFASYKLLYWIYQDAKDNSKACQTLELAKNNGADIPKKYEKKRCH